MIDQTYENIELILIDDGSKDGYVLKIQAMVKVYEYKFLRLEFTSGANIGVNVTISEYLKWCEEKYLSAIASDYIMLHKNTCIQVNHMECETDIRFLFGSADYVNEIDRIYY